MVIKRKEKNTQEAKAKAIAKEREKRRKKMIRTKFGQAPLRHARKGIKSCFYAAFSVFFFFLLIASSFMDNGDVGILMGIAGFIVAGLAWGGFRMALQGLKERDKNYITCKIGIGINGAVLLFMFATFIRGLM